MNTLATFHCPNCDHPIFKYQLIEGSMTPQTAAPPANDSTDTGRDGNTCPKCGRHKNTGYDFCIDCNRDNLDQCPKCGGNKQKQYPTCYKCKDQGSNAPAEAANAFANVPDDDEEDDPF